MTTLIIEQVLVAKMLEITPALSTVYQNMSFTPVSQVPYQRIDILFAKPSNSYVHRSFNQSGFMQVTLFYPEMVGAKDARTRAELIRSKFKSGSNFSGVHITNTPEIGAARNEDGRFVLPVFVEFSKLITEV